MRHPQLLIYESDGRLARVLRPIAAERRWAFHEPRRTETVLEQLKDSGPAILVLRLGKQLEKEMMLLDQVGQQAPDTATIVVGDVENEPIAGLAWDLGAKYVLFPPQPRELLRDVVIHLMETATPAAGEPA
jgi:DNA-binding response OmpR family regulator